MSAAYRAAARDVPDSDSDSESNSNLHLDLDLGRADVRPRVGRARQQGRRDRPVIPKLVIRQAGPTITLSRQKLSVQDLADLQAAVGRLPAVPFDAAALPNIVRVALVTELAFAYAAAAAAKSGTAASGGDPQSLDAVRHTVQLAKLDKDDLKTALVNALSSVDAGTELPATALVSLGRCCAGDIQLEKQWATSLPAAHSAWQRLKDFTESAPPVVTAPPCIDTADQMLKDLVQAANLDEKSTKEDLLGWTGQTVECASKLNECNTETAELNARLSNQHARVMKLAAALTKCETTATNTAAELAVAANLRQTATAQDALLKEILGLLGKDQSAQNEEVYSDVASMQTAATKLITALNEKVAAAAQDMAAAKNAHATAEARCKECAEKVEEAKKTEEQTVLGQLRKAYSTVTGSEARDDQAADALSTGIVQKMAAIAGELNRANTASTEAQKQAGVEQTALAALKTLHSTVVGTVTENAPVNELVTAIRHKCGASAETARTLEDIQKKYLSLQQQTRKFSTGSVLREDAQAETGLDDLRASLVALAGNDNENTDKSMGEIVQVIRAKLEQLATAQQAEHIARRDAVSATEAQTQAPDALEAVRKELAELAGSTEGATPTLIQAIRAKLTAATTATTAANAATEVKVGELTTLHDKLKRLAGVDGAFKDAASAELIDAITYKLTVAAKQREVADNGVLAVDVKQEAAEAIKAKDAPESQIRAVRQLLNLSDEGDLGEALATVARRRNTRKNTLETVVKNLGLTVDAGVGYARTLETYANRIAGERAEFVKRWVLNKELTGDLHTALTEFASNVLEKLRQGQGTGDLASVVRNALEKLEKLSAAAPNVANDAEDDDGDLTQLLEEIDNVVELPQLTFDGGGKACKTAVVRMRQVLRVFETLRAGYRDLIKQSGAATTLKWKLSPERVVKVFQTVQVVPMPTPKDEVPVVSQMMAYSKSFEAMTSAVNTSYAKVNLTSGISMLDKLNSLLDVATKVISELPLVQRRKVLAASAVDVDAIVATINRWSTSSGIKEVVRTTLNMDQESSTKNIEQAVGSLFRVAHQLARRASDSTDTKLSVGLVTAALQDSLDGLSVAKFKKITDWDAKEKAFVQAFRKAEYVESQAQERLAKLAAEKEELAVQKDQVGANEMRRARELQNLQSGLLAKGKDLAATVETHLAKLRAFGAKHETVKFATMINGNVSLVNVAPADTVVLTQHLTAWAARNTKVTWARKVSDHAGGMKTRVDSFDGTILAARGAVLVTQGREKKHCFLRHVGRKGSSTWKDNATIEAAGHDGHKGMLVVTTGNAILCEAKDGEGEAEANTWTVQKLGSLIGHDVISVGLQKFHDNHIAILVRTNIIYTNPSGVTLGLHTWNTFEPSGGQKFGACAMAASDGTCMGVVAANKGLVLLHWWSTPKQVFLASRFEELEDVQHVDMQRQVKNYVLAFTHGRMVSVAELSNLREGDTTARHSVYVPGTGPLLAVSISMGDDDHWQGVTVADADGTHFLPSYELKPATVFEALHEAVEGVTTSLDAFQQELTAQATPVSELRVGDDTTVARGGASAQELVPYAADSHSGSFAQSSQSLQSSALLLDLLRW